MIRHPSCAVVALALVIGVAVAAPAAASGADHQAWAQTGPVLTFAPAEDELYVAVTAGSEEARSYVDLDLSGMGEQEIRSSSLTLEEAESSLRADTGQIVACALEGPMEADGKLSGPPPAPDCSVRAGAIRADDGTWTVELAVFAPRWVAGADRALVLLPDPSATAATFRVAFAVAATTVVAPEQASTPSTFEPAAPTAGPAITPDLRGPSFSDLTPPLQVPQTTGVGDGSPDDRVADASGGPIAGRSTAGSSFAWMALLVAAAVVIVAVTPLRRRVALPTPTERAAMARPTALIALVGLALLPLLAREVIVYKAGVVMIFFVAAIGLHVLVNWAGELSLAHAGMVGLPAFSVLALSSVHDISAVYLLPVGVIVGGAVGAIVALPTLRARGVQVALVTLIAGIAIDRYFFTKSWLVGPVSGRAAAAPRLGPIEFTTSRSLYIVLVVVVAGAVLAAWVLMHSKVARAWYWIRVNADAAAAFGVPVVVYRILAYATGGAFAGLAGGLTVMWTQRLGPGAFPTSSSFTYLLVAVLAGAGFLGGLVATTLMLPGGQQFATNIFGVETGKAVDAILAYGGPLGLIQVLIFHKSGLNGLGRNLMARIAPSTDERIEPAPARPPLRGDAVSLSLIGGVLAILAGFLAIALAWSHSSKTDQLWVQNQEMLSGGLGGLALVCVGVGLLIRDRLGRNHLLLAHQLEALLGANGSDRESTDPDPVVMSPATDGDGAHPPTERVRTRRPRPLSRIDG